MNPSGQPPAGAGGPPPPPSAGHLLSAAVLLALPALFVAAIAFVNQARGPRWLGHNADPDYGYLFPMLDMAQGLSPRMYDHPGGPFMMVGGLSIRCIYLSSGQGDLVEDVLTDSEYYLDRMNYTFVALGALGLFAAGLATRWATGNLAYALLVQGAPMLSATLLFEVMPTLLPEAMFVLLDALLIVLLLAYLKLGTDRNRLWFTVLFGLLAGFALATKVIAVPFVVIPFLLLPGWHKLLLAPPAATGFFVGTLPILRHYPAWWEQTVRMVTRQGYYGWGEAGVLDPAKHLSGLWELAKFEPLLAGLIVVSLAAVVWFWLARRGAAHPAAKLTAKALAAVTLAELAHLGLCGKYPLARYLMLTIGLMGLNVVFLAELVRLCGASSRGKSAGALRLAFWGAVAAVVVGMVVYQYQGLRKTRQNGWEAQQYVEGLWQVLREKYPNHIIITHYGASSLPAAMHYGVYWYSDWQYCDQLYEMYPRAPYYDCMGNYFTGFNYHDPLDLEKLLTGRRGVLAWGWALDEETGDMSASDKAPVRYIPPYVRYEQVYPESGPAAGSMEVLYLMKHADQLGQNP